MKNKQNIRPAVVAGRFYTDDNTALTRQINTFLSEARPHIDHLSSPKAIIVPHAGYVYSGQVAAYGYAAVEKANVKTIILLGISHRHLLSNKVAVYHTGGFKTPLGICEIDEDMATKLINSDPNTFVFHPEAHLNEHSLEVQLPFLQIIYSNIKIVPLLANDINVTQKIATALHQITNENTLLVASSDLSHYPAYDDAVQVDTKSLQKIEDGDPEALITHNREWERKRISELHTCMCGEVPIVALMRYANLIGMNTIKTLKYANSGDAAYGEKSRVVGYGAVGFFN